MTVSKTTVLTLPDTLPAAFDEAPLDFPVCRFLVPDPALLVNLRLSGEDVDLLKVDEPGSLVSLPEQEQNGNVGDAKVSRDEPLSVPRDEDIEAQEDQQQQAQSDADVASVRHERCFPRETVAAQALRFEGVIETNPDHHHQDVDDQDCAGGQPDEPLEDGR